MIILPKVGISLIILYSKAENDCCNVLSDINSFNYFYVIATCDISSIPVGKAEPVQGAYS